MSDTTKVDFKVLWNILMPWAEQELKEKGTFNAFGAAISPDNKVGFFQAQGFDTTREIIEAGLREEAQKGRCRATAIICDVRAGNRETGAIVDAVHLALDHTANKSVVFVQAYTIDAEKNILFDKAEAYEGADAIFPRNSPPKKS